MSTYFVSVEETNYKVQISGAQLLLNGSPVDYDISSLNGNGVHQLRLDKRNQEVYLRSLSPDTNEVSIDGQRFITKVDLPNRHSRRKTSVRSTGNISAPMPGLIVDVLVQEGDMVAEKEVLVVQEAMKMQMQIKAPFAGRVESIQCSKNSQVGKGSLLVQLSKI